MATDYRQPLHQWYPFIGQAGIKRITKDVKIIRVEKDWTPTGWDRTLPPKGLLLTFNDTQRNDEMVYSYSVCAYIFFFWESRTWPPFLGGPSFIVVIIQDVAQTIQDPSTTPNKELKLWIHRPDNSNENQQIERQEQEKEPSVSIFMNNHLLGEIQ